MCTIIRVNLIINKITIPIFLVSTPHHLLYLYNNNLRLLHSITTVLYWREKNTFIITPHFLRGFREISRARLCCSQVGTLSPQGQIGRWGALFHGHTLISPIKTTKNKCKITSSSKSISEIINRYINLF